MSIRNAAKAVILHHGKILLTKCWNSEVGEYYVLPGGGQNQYETMEEAVIRECLEETGYRVVPEALAALYEEIYTDQSVQEQYPDYSHKILHVFRCRLSDAPQETPSEEDSSQVGCVWLDAAEISSVNLLPSWIREHFQSILESPSPLYLGSHAIESQKTV